MIVIINSSKVRCYLSTHRIHVWKGVFDDALVDMLGYHRR